MTGKLLALILLLPSMAFGAGSRHDWFEQIKSDGRDDTLYRVLYAMPKGGDLHLHLSGSVLPEWWYELALDQADNGYIYYTKTAINNCREYGGDEFGHPYLMYFLTIQESTWKTLGDCEKTEYEPLAELDAVEKSGWLRSIQLDKPWEGRNEFFQTHWQRLGDLVANPHLMAEVLIRNMQAFGDEGLIYMEPDLNAFISIRPDGSRIPPAEVVEIVRKRLQDQDARSTGVTVRFQAAILRFLPNAEDALRQVWQFVADNQDLWVGVDMVGREDDDKGYPGRFLPVLRDLRRTGHGVRLSIHAGEVDEPNHHVRDTLLLGAERIGHGVNLITDPDTMLLMRGDRYLVEINLISNLLLGYVKDFSAHPFPEYLRTGIPVALSTDDRGMWGSNLTDEFFVAVKTFHLSWEEVKLLSRNSLEHAFVDRETRERLLERWESRISRFEKTMNRDGVRKIDKKSLNCGRFIRNHYNFCDAN